jgi:hypothetical protein
MDEQLEFVAYCGLYCGLCAGRSRIPQRATALQQAMADEGWNFWGQGIPGFPEFWQFLQGLADEGGCPGCRAGGGDFPCERVEAFGCRYPTLLADNRRLQAVGPVRWVSEQEERARRGVVYADTRYSAEVTE